MQWLRAWRGNHACLGGVSRAPRLTQVQVSAVPCSHHKGYVVE